MFHPKFLKGEVLEEQSKIVKGKIRLEIFNRGDKTRIKDVLTTPPFLIQRALYPDERHQQIAHIYLMSSSGGVLQGDELYININAGKNTCAHVTTQAATKIYSMNNNSAKQNITLYLQKNSYLEFVPFQIIPYKTSQYFQTTNIHIDKDASLFYSEILTAGRIASNERFEMDRCHLKVQAYDLDDNLLFTDVLRIEPEKDKSLIDSVFSAKNILATIYLVGKKFGGKQIENILENTVSEPFSGCSILPNDCGIVIRILSDNQDHVFSAISKLLENIRLLCLDADH